MKRTVIAIAAAIAATAPAAFAQYDRPYPDRPYYNTYDNRDDNRYDNRYDNNRYDDNRYDNRFNTARVIDTQPVYASSREECWNTRTGQYEERHDRGNRIGAGTAAGALIGGVIGHQVDHGVGTAAGALLGGLAGHEIEKDRGRNDDLDYSNCRTASSDSAIDGYNVRYAYRGQEYVTRMSYDPGPTLRVGEDINSDGTPMNPVG